MSELHVPWSLTEESFLNEVITKLEKEIRTREQRVLQEQKQAKLKELDQMTIKAYTNQYLNLDDFGFSEHKSGINLSFKKSTISVSWPKRLKWDTEKKFRCMCDFKFTNDEYSKFLDFLRDMGNE